MAKREKTFAEMNLEEVRQKLGYAINSLCMYAEDRKRLESILKDPEWETKLFATVNDLKKTHEEFCKRFNAPAHYAEEEAA